MFLSPHKEGLIEPLKMRCLFLLNTKNNKNNNGLVLLSFTLILAIKNGHNFPTLQKLKVFGCPYME